METERLKRKSASRVAFEVAAIFAGVGVAWVLLTDVLLYRFVDDPVLIARLETAKGWTFVTLATALLYLVTFRSARSLDRAKTQMSAVIDSIADGVMLLGRERTIVRVNPAAARMLDADDLVGMNADDFSRRYRVSALDGSLVRPEDFLSQRVFDDQGGGSYKAVLYPPGASELIVSVTAAVVRRDEHGVPEMAVSVIHDITASEQLERLRDHFFSVAAHTLKTPVAIIKANAETLQRADQYRKPALRSKATTAIYRQCFHIDRLVQNVLVISRIRSGTLQLYPANVDLAPLIEAVADEMSGACRPRSVFSRVDTSMRVHVDRERLMLALRNLIDEAVRSSPASTPVTVRLSRRGRDAVIGVCYQIASAVEGPQATGDSDEIDLAHVVTKEIVHAHGGSLWTERSEAGMVACISIAETDEDDVTG